MSLKSIGHGFKDIFYNSLSPMLIIDTDAPSYTMLDVNNAYLQSAHTNREDIIGKPVFGVFPSNPTDEVSKNIERTIFSFEQTKKNKVPHIMSNYRYDIPIPGSNEFEVITNLITNTVKRPLLIIIDILQGPLVRDIKACEGLEDIVMLLMTGYASKPADKNLPVDDFIEKPFDLPLFEKKIKNLLEGNVRA